MVFCRPRDNGALSLLVGLIGIVCMELYQPGRQREKRHEKVCKQANTVWSPCLSNCVSVPWISTLQTPLPPFFALEFSRFRTRTAGRLFVLVPLWRQVRGILRTIEKLQESEKFGRILVVFCTFCRKAC